MQPHCIGKSETCVAGEDCSRPCPAGKFGPNCVHDCYCHNGNIHNRSPKKTKIQLYTCFYSHFYRRSALQPRRWQMQMQARLSSPSSRNIHPSISYGTYEFHIRYHHDHDDNHEETPGYAGARCEDLCPEGYFGQDCYQVVIRSFWSFGHVHNGHTDNHTLENCCAN